MFLELINYFNLMIIIVRCIFPNVGVTQAQTGNTFDAHSFTSIFVLNLSNLIDQLHASTFLTIHQSGDTYTDTTRRGNLDVAGAIIAEICHTERPGPEWTL